MVFSNAIIKNPQMNHCPCPKCYDIQTQHVQITDQNKQLKEELKVENDLSKYPATKELPVSTLFINLRWSEVNCLTLTPHL